MISQSKISKASNRIFKENAGRRISEFVLERDYCVAWFLVGLSRCSIKDTWLFKGGTALRRCYFENYRFSEDMDFTLLKPMSFDQIKEELERVYNETKSASNIKFQFLREDLNTHQNCYTFYLTYEGPLPATSNLKEIKVDMTISEKVYFAPENKSILKSCEEFTDLPINSEILVYSLREIASEKTVALLDKARNEPRDLFDLWYLTEENKSVNLEECLSAIRVKLEYQKKNLDQVKNEFENKQTRLRSIWTKRLGMQMNSLPEFESVYRAVKRNLRQANII